MKTMYDIIIVGSGIVGTTLACALAQETPLSIALLEAKESKQEWSATRYHHRVSAITLASQHIFQSLQLWDAIQNKRVSPFKKIQVWDALHQGAIDFDCADIAESRLGFIIENNAMQSALEEKLKQYPQIEYHCPVALKTFFETENGVELITADERIIRAKLAIAADGAHSWLREQAGITIQQYDYEQQAIVCTVRTELPHQKMARQCFLERGPLAFLPLSDEHFCSIVWSVPHDEAERLLSLDEEKFKDVLGFAFAHRLGDVLQAEERYAFPLVKQQAKNYVKSRVVLVGDAAHTVHPLAGQGVNLGLLDAACLAEILADVVQKRKDFAGLSGLRRYERWRKADNFAMLTGVDLIKQLFASDKKSIQHLRSIGLNMTNQMALIKKFFTRYAVGDRNNLPRFARCSH